MSKSFTDLPTNVEFIQAITVDINGLSRGPIYPKRKFASLADGKEENIGLMELYGTRNELPSTINELSGHRNKSIVPDMSTFRIAPWSEDGSLAMVLCDTCDLNTQNRSPFNPRWLAKQKIKELEGIGYKLLIGVENQFRLFDKNQQPIMKHGQKFGHFTAITAVLPFVKELTKKLAKQDIEINNWSMESGMGQMGIPLTAYKGMYGVDNVWLFRELSKYVASDMNLSLSYMTNPLAHDNASVMRINHSLLRAIDSGNAMQSPEHDGKLSDVGQHWLAGLIKHSSALSAFTNPTVNCYRRMRNGGSMPQGPSWNYLCRDVSYRVTTNAHIDKRNYIECRTPSSSCNIYLAIAAMIVAGMDGIRTEMNLCNPGNEKTLPSLPRTLSEALTALRDDGVMIAGLGPKFVDWYIKAKTDCDVNVLKKVDLDADTPEALQDEFHKYFIL